jgi:predicted nucleotidyltransferase
LGYPFEEGKYAVIPLSAQHRAELGALCRRYHVRRLELFGSAASGQDRLGESDLDFLVEFDPPPPGAYADAYFGLLEALQSLFGRPVDLVVASAIKNPYFRQSVEQTKTLLYAS